MIFNIDKVLDYFTSSIRMLKGEKNQNNEIDSLKKVKECCKQSELSDNGFSDVKNKLIRFNKYSREDVHNIFSPNTNFRPGCGAWGLHGIIRLPNNNYIFFVTYGSKQADHVFQEGISSDGKLIWQSQPQQTFASKDIQNFIKHDSEKNDIYLFKRDSKSEKEYSYMGKLKYVSHDPDKQAPVWFTWQIIDWDNKDKIVEENVIKENKPQYDYDENTIENLRMFIDNMYAVLGVNYLTYNNIYAKISIMDEDLFDRLEIKGNPDKLYSIIKYYNKDYYYNNEFIGKTEIPPLEELLIEKIRNEKFISYKKVKSICEQMMINKSYKKDDYIQLISLIDKDYYVINDENDLVNKEQFKIDEVTEQNIRDVLKNLIESNNEIDLNNFKSYMFFPKIEYPWNKEILKIVIEKYYEDYFYVSNEHIYKKGEINGEQMENN